jgi:hypothetical protein
VVYVPAPAHVKISPSAGRERSIILHTKMHATNSGKSTSAWFVVQTLPGAHLSNVSILVSCDEMML